MLKMSNLFSLIPYLTYLSHQSALCLDDRSSDYLPIIIPDLMPPDCMICR